MIPISYVEPAHCPMTAAGAHVHMLRRRLGWGPIKGQPDELGWFAARIFDPKIVALILREANAGP
jgi:hypothetical protein